MSFDAAALLPIPIKAAPSCGLELEFGAMRVRSLRRQLKAVCLPTAKMYRR